MVLPSPNQRSTTAEQVEDQAPQGPPVPVATLPSDAAAVEAAQEQPEEPVETVVLATYSLSAGELCLTSLLETEPPGTDKSSSHNISVAEPVSVSVCTCGHDREAVDSSPSLPKAAAGPVVLDSRRLPVQQVEVVAVADLVRWYPQSSWQTFFHRNFSSFPH
jgi:hypothetical protein